MTTVRMTRQGPPGRAGKSILSGEGAPTGDVGIVGDHYVDDLTLDLWGPKDADEGWGDEASGSLIGPLLAARLPTATIGAAATFDPDLHQGRLLRLSASGESVLTLPDDIDMAGCGGTVDCDADSYVRFSAAAGAALQHPYDHTRGLPKGLAVFHAVLNAAGDHLIWKIGGATQP